MSFETSSSIAALQYPLIVFIEAPETGCVIKNLFLFFKSLDRRSTKLFISLIIESQTMAIFSLGKGIA